MQYIRKQEHLNTFGSPIQTSKMQQYVTPIKPKDTTNFENLIYTDSTNPSLSPFGMVSPDNLQNTHDICSKVIFDEEIRHHLTPETKQQIKPFFMTSPEGLPKSKASRQLCFDRYIPSRTDSNFQIALTDVHEKQGKDQPHSENEMQVEKLPTPAKESHKNQQELFRSHVLGLSQKPSQHDFFFKNTNILHYQRDENIIQKEQEQKKYRNVLIPSDEDIQNLNIEKKRKISEIPYRILDAPQLQDDFYLNVLDWSYSNILAVGLSSATYLWSPTTSKVTKLMDLPLYEQVTSLCWSDKEQLLAVGTSSGEIQLWDSTKLRLLYSTQAHNSRVGAITWNQNIFSSGSRDKSIITYDVRCPTQSINKLANHKQEVCGLKWSPDGQQLASGGNDNKLLVWQLGYKAPSLTLRGHSAAVKALTWSTQQNNVLLSGGGSADRTIRFWNTVSGSEIGCIDTGSQVCNLSFSINSNEFVSTHGYSNNEINVWRYPNLQKVASLTGHSLRVLYLARSPDGSSVVTGAGDETLRFWNVFENDNSFGGSKRSKVIPSFGDLR